MYSLYQRFFIIHSTVKNIFYRFIGRSVIKVENNIPFNPENVMMKHRHKSAVQQTHPNRNLISISLIEETDQNET